MIYDEAPKPRILLQNVKSETALHVAVQRYSGTVGFLRGYGDGLRVESWDAIVSVGDPQLSASNLRVIQIGGTPCGSRWSPGSRYYQSIDTITSYGAELVINDDLPSALAQIVKRELLPQLRTIPLPRGAIVTPHFSASNRETHFTPLISDLDGNAFAAIYRPDSGAQECLYLPEGIADITPWLLYVFERWSADAPDIFPAAPDWTRDDRWMTAGEIDARDSMVSARAEVEKAVRRLEEVEREAESSLALVSEAANRNERKLLTGTGDVLVAAVSSALERIGFTVHDMDAEGRREKLEDLRIEDPAEDRWLALCEIKGYNKGGQLNDLQKLGRFVERYLVENKGRMPQARWYVVNQFRDRDPSTRKQLLWGQDTDLVAFGESGGLTIDTRSIFLLDKDVTTGSISQDDAKRLLKNATGRFDYPVERPMA